MDFRSKCRIRFARCGIIMFFLSLLVVSLISPSVAQENPSGQNNNQAQAIQKPPAQEISSSKQAEATGSVAFGYDVFRQTEEPITEGPIDDQYVLSPGDEVVIRVWGQLKLDYPLTVSEEGFIEIPDSGSRIFTNGLSLKELKAQVNKALAGIYASYINLNNPAQSTAFVDVKLGKVRKLLVYVVGEVKNPGAYTVSSGAATLLNLLNNAGGVLTTGTLREVKIRRADGAIDTIDLYDFLITGKIDTRKTQIRAGDYVIVSLKQKSVTVLGEVKRPGIYEAIGTEGIRDLVRFAGGLTSNAILKRAQVRRFEMNTGEKVLDINIENIVGGTEKDFVLSDGDELTLFPSITSRRKIVEILGMGIKRAGIYQFTPGMRIADLIARAEGLKEDVYIDRADFVRTNDDFSNSLRIFSLKDLYAPTGPGQFKFIGTPAANLELRELDTIVIYSAGEFRGKDKKVSIEGQVKQPGTFALADNLNLFDLVFSRGGFQDVDYRKSAYMELAHIVRKIPGEQGEKLIPFNLGKLLSGDSAENLKLESDDRVIIYSYETFRSKPNVKIVGLIKKPGTYPLYQDMTLEDLVLAAGGLSLEAFNVEAVIARSSRAPGSAAPEATPQETAITVSLPLDYATRPTEKKTKLQVFDMITVRNLPGWEPAAIASIAGEVVYAGEYAIPKNENRISSLVKKAGGLRTGAFPEGAVLLRRVDVVQMTPKSGQSDEEPPKFNRIAIDLKKALENPGGPFDLALKNGDQISIPTNPGTVEVKGAVGRPAVLQHKGGESLGYYISLCGGYAGEADKSEIVVYLPTGTAAKVSRALFFGSNPAIPAGTVIDVPFKNSGKDVVGDKIEVRGAVKFPLSVTYRRGQKLEYYLKMCGGLRDDAEAGNVTIHLPDGNILSAQGTVPFNPVIEPGSAINVPVRPAEEGVAEGKIEVRGAVGSPVSVIYQAGRKLDYYLKMCGGLRDDADGAKVTVRLPGGKILAAEGLGPFNPVIESGSVIDVPVKK